MNPIKPEPPQSGSFPATFEHLVLPHRALLYRRALRLTQSSDEAEDLVQETLLHAFRRFASFQAYGPVHAWLFTILRNCFISEHRLRSRAPHRVSLDALDNPDPLLPRAAGPERRILSEMEYEALYAAVAVLPPNLRSVLVLADFDELTYREVSDRLRIPMGTVRSRLFRARNQIRRDLEAWRPDLQQRTKTLKT